MPSSLRDLEKDVIEGERPTLIMSLEKYTNTKYANKISLDMLDQAEITNRIKRITQFQKIIVNIIHSPGSYIIKRSKIRPIKM